MAVKKLLTAEAAGFSCIEKQYKKLSEKDRATIDVILKRVKDVINTSNGNTRAIVIPFVDSDIHWGKEVYKGYCESVWRMVLEDLGYKIAYADTTGKMRSCGGIDCIGILVSW